MAMHRKRVGNAEYLACVVYVSPLLSLLDFVSYSIDPRACFAPEELQFRLWQLNFVCEQTVLQTPCIRSVAFDDPDGTATCRAHASLHRFARASVWVGMIDVAFSRDRYMLLRNHECVRGYTSRSTFAVRAVAYQAVDVGERNIHRDL